MELLPFQVSQRDRGMNRKRRRIDPTNLAVTIGGTALQILLVLVIVFGDIGFDHPGRHGLDFDDLIGILTVFGFIVLVKSVYYAYRRLWQFLLVEACISMMALLVLMMT